MTPDGSSIGNLVLGGIGVLNVATVVYLVKVVISPIAMTVKTLSESVKELYQSRDNHEVEITQIQTIHKVKGCDLPQSIKSGA
jgi:hypothetical protein